MPINTLVILHNHLTLSPSPFRVSLIGVTGAGIRSKTPFVRVCIGEHMFANIYIHICGYYAYICVSMQAYVHVYLSLNSAGTFLDAHTHAHNDTQNFTLVSQPSRGLLSFHALLCRVHLVAFKTG